ncbi:MAG TPA: putative toxin-antitoxin system toxin component, PIN family [Chitinophagaceae bacterium]|nr:putative toxin-antitoxin system toxin component, PIN family [Chitinophagaceae bacterium]HMZ46590.1 putative toxin-antitoxin system toxin component, PIN family [Chitinophagaceae bacterium]HNE94100.1 putative toxin-antitoxin system toxin component, PIN family [Chitinophagaceae bacterium]HNF29899.1 putative toxin-antitoxin system toxin component, PIN family [Chitinophagaceae bacterium]HNN31477.1 putative toxin-antitoxin system toxin component, PIN family [Chitinophagaceae bacterium]
MPNKSIKVIFDTNIWISFLIGKHLAKIKRYLSNGSIIIITSEQLISEIKVVTGRAKLKKYFPHDSVEEMIELLETIAIKVETKSTHFVSRDPKDNFLLDLIDFSKADFLVTGDKDLLELSPFKTAQILTPTEFETQLKN